MKKGMIFNIQKFSVNDGPGIRTTVFMKGCPLRCLWCHNPESNSVKPDLFYNGEKCTGCGQCAAVCPKDCHKIDETGHRFDRNACVLCGACADACPSGALELAGYETTVDHVLETVLQDKAFYETSGGGMTLSGGEPMYQFDFALSLMQAAKAAGLHTCMETCGFAPWEHYAEIAPYTDIFLFDYKLTNPDSHKTYTGADNSLILENLKKLDDLGCATVLRCPIIPTVNDHAAHFAGIAQTANSLKHILRVDIEPYHPLGKGKTENLDKNYALDDLTFPAEETVSAWIAEISRQTTVPVQKG